MEEAPVVDLFERPRHPYTEGLLASVLKLGSSSGEGEERRLNEIPGTVPSLKDEIVGCPFAPRCSYATDYCRANAPVLEEKAPEHFAACFHSDQLVEQEGRE
ncbi:oligopeptide/dipeptide ABC transporter ATP-binding protein [Fodinicurvata halophila]